MVQRGSKESSRTARGEYDRYSRSSRERTQGASRSRGRHTSDAAASLSRRGEKSTYSRRDGSARYSQQMHRKRRFSRIIKRTLITLVSLLVVGAIGAFAYMNYLNGNLARGLGGLSNVLVKPSSNSQPFYMLLCGTDQSIQRDKDQSTGGTYRTDSMILARIDPSSKTVTLISLPRDTKVELAGHGIQKLNAAYAFGGSELAVSTVAKISGVDISHFALVDMDGLKEVIDALGGIEVDVPIDINDPDAGGHLSAGSQTLTGEQALILCRSRHAYDSYGDGDAYRAADQRLVLQAIAKKLLSSDPVTIANTVTKLSDYVQTDMSVTDIAGLAQSMQGLDTENNLYTASMPTESVYENKTWYEEIVTDAWKAMMARVDEGLSPTDSTEIDKNTGVVLSNAGSSEGSSSSSGDTSSVTSADNKGGTVVVRNGSGKAGVASKVADKIKAAGYSVSDTGNADTFNYKSTMVVYSDSANAQEAEDIAQVVGGGAIAKMNNGSYSMKGDFLVVIGSSYSG